MNVTWKKMKLTYMSYGTSKFTLFFCEGYKFKVVEYSMRTTHIFILIKKYLSLEV